MTNDTTVTPETVITPATSELLAKQTLFRVGWNYSTFLSKNGLPPGPIAHNEWLSLSRDASKGQIDSMRELAFAGAKTKVAVKAVLNRKDGRFDTSMTARVVKPGCDDMELIADAVRKSIARDSKRQHEMMGIASRLGVII